MYEVTFKLILIRSSGIGDIIESIVNKFDLGYKQTTGVDFLTKVVEYEEGKTAGLSILDIDIDIQHFKSSRKAFFEGAEGALIFFDLTHRETHEEVKMLYAEIKETIGSVPFILIGDKGHLDHYAKLFDNGVLSEDARDFARNEGGTYIEITPDDVDPLEKAVFDLTCAIIKKRSNSKV